MSNDNKPIEPFHIEFGVQTLQEEPPELRDARLRQAKRRHRKSGDTPYRPDQPRPHRFDPYRRAKSPTLKSSIGALIGYLKAHEKREKRRRPDDARHFAVAVEALACNLLVLHMVNPARPLAVPRGHDVLYLLGKDKPEAYGRHFTTAIDLMAGCGLITQTQLGYRHDAKHRQFTLLVLNAAASNHLPVGHVTWDDFGREARRDVLILKAPKTRRKAATSEQLDREAAGHSEEEAGGKRIFFDPTPATERLEAEVHRINALLDTADFGIDAAAVSNWEDPKTGTIIDPSQRQVCRIFNNASWEQDGRLYHGFWEVMPKEIRQAALRIEGEPAVNVDFAQLYPRLAYAQVGVTPAMDDLYDIEGGRQHRSGWKKLMNALLSADHLMKKWPKGVEEELGHLGPCPIAIAILKARHAAIAHMFGTGIGLKLMYTESRILLTALPRLYAAGIVALPLHDSVLTAKSKAEAATVIMEEAYMEVTGQNRAFVTIG